MKKEEKWNLKTRQYTPLKGKLPIGFGQLLPNGNGGSVFTEVVFFLKRS
jgi:hypothetical protein